MQNLTNATMQVNGDQIWPVHLHKESGMATRQETIINTLVKIQADPHRAISFKDMECDALAEDKTTICREESLFISIDDGGDGASFFFEDAHEAITFLQRALEQAKNRL